MAKRIVIIGGVAAGPKIAAKLRRLDHEAEITIIEKGKFLSYAGCGLPYYICEDIKEQRELMETPVGVLRDPEFFEKTKNVKVYNRTEAIKVDRLKRSRNKKPRYQSDKNLALRLSSLCYWCKSNDTTNKSNRCRSTWYGIGMHGFVPCLYSSWN